ncbi:MAG: hypothetical protein ACE15F_20005 [bacterium]
MWKKVYGSLFMVLSVLVLPGYAQYGVFDKTADWGGTDSPPRRGTYKVPGSVVFANGVYTLQGNGDDIWDNNDEGFFVYTEKAGSWSLSGKAHWLDSGGGNEWAKIGVMIREIGPKAGSRHYWTALRTGTAGTGDRTDAQWRNVADAASGNVEIRTPDNLAVDDKGDGVWLRVSRIAGVNLVLAEYSYDGVNWVFGHIQQMAFPETVAYGLAISNHLDNELLAEGTVSEVKLESTVPAAGYRTLSLEDPVYSAGEPITVTLAVGGGTGSITVEETPPAGWVISQISNGGTESGGKITWTLTAATTLTYVVTPPAGASGDVTFTGKVGSTPIAGANAISSPKPAGIFDNHLDIGAVGAAGNAEYDDTTKMYTVTGSGADIWDIADQFHFLYKKLSGAFSMQATIYAYNDTSTNEWSKAGIMVRDNLTPGSPHIQGIVRGSDMQYDTQWRPAQGSASSNLGLKTDATGDIRVVRNGNTFQVYYMNNAGDWVLDSTQTIPMTDPVYVGFAVTSHENPNYSVGEYTNANLTLYPFQVLKSFSAEEVNQGESIDVVLTVEVREGQPSNITIKETYSPGANVSQITPSAGQATDDQNGTITWTLTGATSTVTLQYTLNVPSDYAGPFVSVSGTFDDGKGYTGSTGSKDTPVKAVDLGIFQGHQDIGNPGARGNVKFDGTTWQVVGSGHDIWDAADDFHYLWMRVSGDFTFSIDEPYIGAFGAVPSTNDWQKMGIMVRQELTAPSAYVYGGLRSSDQGLILQWRDSSGGSATWEDVTTAASDWNPNYDPNSAGINNPRLDQVKLGGTIKLTREGDLFTLWYVIDGQDTFQHDHTLILSDPIYLGIAVTSHQTGATSQGLFKNPKFEGTVVGVKDWMLHQ